MCDQPLPGHGGEAGRGPTRVLRAATLQGPAEEGGGFVMHSRGASNVPCGGCIQGPSAAAEGFGEVQGHAAPRPSRPPAGARGLPPSGTIPLGTPLQGLGVATEGFLGHPSRGPSVVTGGFVATAVRERPRRQDPHASVRGFDPIPDVVLGARLPEPGGALRGGPRRVPQGPSEVIGGFTNANECVAPHLMLEPTRRRPCRVAPPVAPKRATEILRPRRPLPVQTLHTCHTLTTPCSSTDDA